MSERRFWMDGLRTMVAGPGELPHEADLNDPDLGAVLARQWWKNLAEPQMVVVPAPDSLEAAWAEAEASLPEDWGLNLEAGTHGRRDLYTASARYCYSLRHYRENVGPSRYVPFEMAHSDTPAAALRALAAKLRQLAVK